jgi:tetratricopeptide (TPR) repeat protein
MPNLAEQYQQFIEATIAKTLKGEFRTKAQVYKLVAQQLENGTSEVLERCLTTQASQLQQQFAQESSEIKQAKITRQINALKTIQEGWEQWQQENGKQRTVDRACQNILQQPQEDRFLALIQTLDPNQSEPLDHSHINGLAQKFTQASEQEDDSTNAFELRQLAAGLTQGLQSYTQLEADLVSWLYADQQAIGFGGATDGHDPWRTWAKKVSSSLPKVLFQNQAHNESAGIIAAQQQAIDISAWVELITLLRSLQIGLVNWFDSQPYNAKAGRNLAAATYIGFASIWCELSNGFQQSSYLAAPDRDQYSQACFQITLQIFRTFAQRDNFPLYGGQMTFFVGAGLRDTIAYLDQPLKAVENTQEKARILTVLGYSQRALNQHQRALELHQEALDLANTSGDQPCAIANLCHISRLYLMQQDYDTALSYGQRALIFARQHGDVQGEANALVSVGYSEVMQLQREEIVSAERLENPRRFLQQGQTLAEKLIDLPNQAFAAVGLGVAAVTQLQMQSAMQLLEQALALVRQIGDRDLQAICFGNLAEVYYQLEQPETALAYAYTGIYLLEQRGNRAWQQAAALFSLLEGKLGPVKFAQILDRQRSQLIQQIGPDGIEHLNHLIDTYRQGR